MSDHGESSGQFQPTRWTVVLSLRQQGDTRKTQASLETLCQEYWYPLYAFARRRGYSEHDAQDVTQGFFGYLLEKDFFASADPTLGKLRTFLLTAFTRYMSRELKSAHALKRGGGRRIESLDEEFAEGDHRYKLEPTDTFTPEMFFTRSWIQTILQKSKAELQRREMASGRGEMLRKLEPFLEDSTEGASYQDVSEDLGMNQVALRKTVSRLRERYREIVREQIAATLKDPTEAAVEAEIRSLWAVLNKK